MWANCITLLTVQIIGVVFILALSLLLGVREKRRIVRELGALPAVADLIKPVPLSEEEQKLARPKLFWWNVLLFLAAMSLLFSGIFRRVMYLCWLQRRRCF